MHLRRQTVPWDLSWHAVAVRGQRRSSRSSGSGIIFRAMPAVSRKSEVTACRLEQSFTFRGTRARTVGEQRIGAREIGDPEIQVALPSTLGSVRILHPFLL